MVLATSAVGETELPPVEESRDQLSGISAVYVQQFRLEGNTVFSDEVLATITALYEGREITAEELQEVRRKLTGYYVANGYVNSGAVIPDQQVRDGVIMLRIVEGRLAETTISGNTWLREGYIAPRLDMATDNGQAPLNVNRLQERLRLLKQDPRIENINASLKPGLKLGEALLDVEVREARPYNVRFTFNNYNSPSIGAYRGEISLSHTNLTGWGDSLALQYALTEGLDEYQVNYTLPLTRWETTLSLGVERSESVVVAAPFDDLDIRSDTITWSADLRHPFHKTVSREVALGLRFEKKESDTSLLGSGFAFSEGVEPDGEADLSVLRFYQEWIDRSLTQVIAARSTFSLGLDILDATDNDTGPDGTFFTWLGQFQWLRRISFLDSQVLFRTDLRLSDSPLLPAEKFEIGGANTVRGYRENQMTPDNGLISSLEWRIPTGHVKIPGLSKKNTDGAIHLCPFFDFGTGWNTDRPDPSPDLLYSTGLGARWSLNEKIHARIYWGWGLKDVENSGEYDLQDDGVHFQVVAALF